MKKGEIYTITEERLRVNGRWHVQWFAFSERGYTLVVGRKLDETIAGLITFLDGWE